MRAAGHGERTVTVTLADSVVGHDFPSGAVHDRRAWVELVAKASGQVVFQSGVVPNDQTSVESLGDPNLWLLSEALFDTAQRPVLFMWEAASAQNVSLPVAVTNDPRGSRFRPLRHRRRTRFRRSADDVKIRVRLAPVALEVVASLIASGSGDLDPHVLPRGIKRLSPIYTLAGTVLAWTAGRPQMPPGACRRAGSNA